MTTQTLPPLAPEAEKYLGRGVIGHVIDGQTVESASGETFEVLDPSTGAIIAHAARAAQVDVDRAVAAARAAFEDGRWTNLPPMERERRLRKMATVLEDHTDVHGDRAVGAALVRHPGVDKISFTGSAETGRKIAETGAATLKHVTLELGGK